MKRKKVILAGLLMPILLLNTVIGHFLPPTGIVVTPAIISIMTGLIVFTDTDFNIFVKSVLSYLFIGLNDIGIKLFAGGRHDMEGVGWIHMFLFIGLVPCFIILLIGVFRDKRSAVDIKILSILVFILLMYLHLERFETLGVHID